MRDYFDREINRVAEVHFLLRPVLSKALKQQVITEAGQEIVGDYATHYDLWTGTFSDKFFDMTTMIRLGTVIEGCLKAYYMDKQGHTTIPELKADLKSRKINGNVFQRVQSWQSNGVIALYAGVLSYDLSTNPHLVSIQEAMAYRHICAHNSGLIDDEYINGVKRITGEDIQSHPFIAAHYPANDTYWFKPLEKLSHFIEETREFFSCFP